MIWQFPSPAKGQTAIHLAITATLFLEIAFGRVTHGGEGRSTGETKRERNNTWTCEALKALSAVQVRSVLNTLQNRFEGCVYMTLAELP